MLVRAIVVNTIEGVLTVGRLILLLLLIAAAWLVWKAFGPSTWKREEPPAIKGADDDEEFLWELKKRNFKERRAQGNEDTERNPE